MSVTLASTWPPRGELARIQRMAAGLQAVYQQIIVAVSPDADEESVKEVHQLPGFRVIRVKAWDEAKYRSLEAALETPCQAVHYCDFDRLLHWFERYPEELRSTLGEMVKTDCLILGRTERAWSTHPCCMIETEYLFNMVFSHSLGLEADYGAGSRGFSRTAATVIMEQADASLGWAVDGAWPLILQREGLRLRYQTVEGLEWETPDQYLDHAADASTVAQSISAYDADPAKWEERVYVANQILKAWFELAPPAQRGTKI